MSYVINNPILSNAKKCFFSKMMSCSLLSQLPILYLLGLNFEASQSCILPSSHHTIYQKVNTWIGQQEKVWDWLRVEKVGRRIILLVELHAHHRSVHGHHGYDGKDRPEHNCTWVNLPILNYLQLVLDSNKTNHILD